MSVTLKQIATLSSIEKVIIHSFDGSLYLVSICLNGEEHYLVDEESGMPIKARHHLMLQKLFTHHHVRCTVLRQQSPYDEMVGQPVSKENNRMEVPLAGAAFA